MRTKNLAQKIIRLQSYKGPQWFQLKDLASKDLLALSNLKSALLFWFNARKNINLFQIHHWEYFITGGVQNLGIIFFNS